MTSAEFRANLEQVRGLLDPKPQPQTPAQAASSVEGGMPITPQCPHHGFLRRGKRGWFCPVKVGDGYCSYTVKA